MAILLFQFRPLLTEILFLTAKVDWRPSLSLVGMPFLRPINNVEKLASGGSNKIWKSAGKCSVPRQNYTLSASNYDEGTYMSAP